MSKKGSEILVQINDEWRLDTDTDKNIQIMHLTKVDTTHHKAKGDTTERWVSRGWYGNLPSAAKALLHKMVDMEAAHDDVKSVESLIRKYDECTKHLTKVLKEVR